MQGALSSRWQLDGVRSGEGKGEVDWRDTLRQAGVDDFGGGKKPGQGFLSGAWSGVSKASVGLGDWALCDGGWSQHRREVRDPG